MAKLKLWWPLIAAWLFLLSPQAEAENFEFVDANGTTGYYVDTGSIAYESAQAANARIAVIKANTNRIFLYSVRFDLDKSTYQIMSSSVETYDTREKLESSAAITPPRPYGPTSPMHAIVAYIKELGTVKQ